MTKINLPSKYENPSNNPEYKKYEGWNKISYSSASAFKTPIYKGDFLKNKFLLIPSDQGIFGAFGNMTGSYLDLSEKDYSHEYMETPVVYKGKQVKHSSADILRGYKQPDNSLYEFEVVIDLEPFGLEKTCMQCFLDRATINDNVVQLVDFKTGSIASKKAYYSGPEYKQLDIYGYGLEELGYVIEDNKCKVVLFDRKGNSFDGVYPLYLTGEVETIEREYNRDAAKEILEDVVKTCIDISDYFAVFNKFFNKK